MRLLAKRGVKWRSGGGMVVVSGGIGRTPGRSDAGVL